MNLNLRKLAHALVVGGIALTMLPLGSNTAFAQVQIKSTAQLKAACETSPGNTVVLTTQSIDLDQGPRPPAAEIVNSGCTIVLSPTANFEAESVGIHFNGPFRIQGVAKSMVFIDEAVISAPSVTLDLAGSESNLMMDQGSLRATAGNLVINLGNLGKMELKQQPVVGGFLALDASGTVQINGSGSLSAALLEATVRGNGGVAISMAGPEALLKTERMTFQSSAGSFTVTSPGQKGLLEMGFSTITSGGAVNMTLAGAESGFKMISTSVTAGSNISFVSGSGAAGITNLLLGDVTATAGGALTVQAAMSGLKGEVGVEKSNLRANGGALRIETGNEGKTGVKETRLTSNSLVRIASGVGGVCLSELNTITAPTQQVCP